MMSATQLEKLPVIGSQAVYHGSLTDCHGRAYLLAHSQDHDPCNELRYALLDLDGRDDLDGVRPESFTTDDSWWPADAVEMDIAGYRYMAHHASYGGSPQARTIHYHMQYRPLGTVWTWFREVTDEIRTLDARR